MSHCDASPEDPQHRHERAVANSLRAADNAAERGDYADALAWLAVIEGIGDTLPDSYQVKREIWKRRAV